LCLEAVFLPLCGISVDFKFFKVLNWTKRQIFGGGKICPFARASQALFGRGAAPLTQKNLGILRYLLDVTKIPFVAGVVDELLLKDFCFLTCRRVSVRTQPRPSGVEREIREPPKRR
jgi:hypothetical protein